MVVGLSAAVFQGAPVVTQDFDLWFKNLPDEGMLEALKKVDGFYISSIPSIGNPPSIGGKDFQFLDLVINMHGIDDFEKEYKKAKTILFEGIPLKVLPLDRIIHSKKSIGRTKDKAVIPALEAALEALKSKK